MRPASQPKNVAGTFLAGEPAYFNHNGSVFYSSNGQVHVAFCSPAHLNFFRLKHPASDLGAQSPSKFGKYLGLATVPECYFEYNGSVFYSDGSGGGLAFTTPAKFEAHKRARPQVTWAGKADVDPTKYLKWATY